jgi:hypothetical protein
MFMRSVPFRNLVIIDQPFIGCGAVCATAADAAVAATVSIDVVFLPRDVQHSVYS